MQTLFEDTELFSSGDLRKQTFELPDAELILWEHFFSREEANQYYDCLLRETDWKQEPITIYGKTMPTPRLTAWYGKRRSGQTPLPLTPTLMRVKQKVEAQCGVHFSSVLLNLYRDGNDSVAWHRDNEREFGVNPIIGSVSFGETRPFEIRHIAGRVPGKLRIPLHHGSFLFMAGTMQHFWEHQVPKTTKLIRTRLNLTFRMVHSSPPPVKTIL